MAYVPDMNYSPEMGIKIKFGKNFLSKIGDIAKSAVAPLVPQTQVVNALSNVKIKTGKKTTKPQTTEPQETTPQEITEEKKIFGLNKKVVLIGGGVIGAIILFSLMKKK
jgi:hypothetical protein